ncbi:MAG: N-formylglutamate amidohydrolase [Cyanobacteria bacterium P01_D01_bin.1]
MSVPNDLFTVVFPEGDHIPVIANLPHSGLRVPEAIAQTFTPHQLQSLPNSDWHLQQLYDFLPGLGITVMQANYSRYVVDLNRAVTPPLFGSFWSAVVPEQTAFKQDIYITKPTDDQVRSRIEQYYEPYHQRLNELLESTLTEFGKVYLLDLHSFMGLITDEVCLGNAKGDTCTENTLSSVNNSFLNQGYQVVKNKVFTGGHIIRRYGQHPGVEALQIEIRYPVYLPDDQLEVETIPEWKGLKFEQAKRKLETVFGEIASELSG